MSFYDTIIAHPFTSTIVIVVAVWTLRMLADFALHVVLAVSAAGAVVVVVNAIQLPENWGQRLSDSLHAELHNISELFASASSFLLH